MLRRKYELKEKHVYKLCDKQLVNNLKSNYEKYHRESILTEDINWNMRIISNKQNSSELIKLPLKIINSVVFTYL